MLEAMGRTSPDPGRRVRLDELLAARGLADSRAAAARLILAGRVRVGGQRADKAGKLLRDDADVEVAPSPRFVSRGGEKLAAALDRLGVRPEGRVCLDVGASTGGFTDCLLQRGARHVYAVDVGHGQLDPRLRGDARVTVLEGVNARRLEPARLGAAASLATVDVAFISLEKVLPAVAACLAADGEIVALVKPQFEVGRGLVGKGGVVRDPALHAGAVLRVARAALALGLQARGVAVSVLRGPKGNREFFLHLARGTERSLPAGFEAAVTAATAPEAG